MIYWITGRSSAGKTVYAKRLKRQFDDLGAKVLLLDGDDVRDRFGNQDYDDDSRLQHIMSIAGFASVAESQGFIVIIAVISPKKEWRMKARKLFDKSIGVSNGTGIFYHSRGIYVFTMLFLAFTYFFSLSGLLFVAILASFVLAFLIALAYYLYESNILKI